MKSKQKSGISLIILVITIIIMLILSGTIVSSMRVSNENAVLSKFINDLTQLQDSVRSIYIMENELPIVNENMKITRADLLNMVAQENRNAFENELVSNGESTNTYFYQLDLEKAGAGEVDNGTGVDGTDDIYVISANSLKVYYLRGIEYEEEMYFSINSKISDIVNLPDTSLDESSLEITATTPYFQYNQ